MTAIGRLTERLTIQQATLTGDGQGGKSKSYSTRAIVWGALEPLTGKEALQAAQETAVLSTAVNIWFRDDLSVTDRIQVNPRTNRPLRTLQIESFNDPTGMRDELRLLCSEVQA